MLLADAGQLSNIFSGLFGAFLGVAVSFGISYWNAIRTSKLELYQRLLKLRTYQFASVTPGDDNARARKAFIETYPEILSAVIAYRNLVLPPEREAITAALIRFRGVTKVPAQNARSYYIPPGTQGDLDTRVDAMLEAIGYRGEGV